MEEGGDVEQPSGGKENQTGRCGEAIIWPGRRHSQPPAVAAALVLRAAKPVPSEQNSRASVAVICRAETEFLKQAHPRPALPTPPLLPSAVSQALQCYSFQHIYFGPFDLSAMKFPNISCLHGCSEAVLSVDTGEGQEAPGKGGRKCRRERGGAGPGGEIRGGRRRREGPRVLGKLGRRGGEG